MELGIFQHLHLAGTLVSHMEKYSSPQTTVTYFIFLNICVLNIPMLRAVFRSRLSVGMVQTSARFFGCLVSMVRLPSQGISSVLGCSCVTCLFSCSLSMQANQIASRHTLHGRAFPFFSVTFPIPCRERPVIQII